MDNKNGDKLSSHGTNGGFINVSDFYGSGTGGVCVMWVVIWWPKKIRHMKTNPKQNHQLA